jgi:hypothetical protein
VLETVTDEDRLAAEHRHILSTPGAFNIKGAIPVDRRARYVARKAREREERDAKLADLDRQWEALHPGSAS